MVAQHLFYFFNRTTGYNTFSNNKFAGNKISNEQSQVVRPGKSDSQFFYDNASSKDKALKLYDSAYHDLLHDTGKEKVMADILEWISKHIY